MVKVEENFRETLKCEYILVIDSEGLMSRVKKTSPNFDNELSTFVVGLSDITLVIFKGEGTEMKNILPLTIHVFLRSKLVEQGQSCYFIHQNMGAVGALTELDTEIHSLLNELDQKTYAAAVDAGQSHKYTKFSHVLEYDSVNDNLFVSGLLDGTQTMGKIDVQYSNQMQKLKSDIICRKYLKNAKSCGTISDLAMRLREVWEVIKHEDFVMSFQNVLAVEAYRKMQRLFDDSEWDVKKYVRAKIKQEINMNENEMWNSKREKNIQKMTENSMHKAEEYISVKVAEMKEKIEHFFKCDGCDVYEDKHIERRHLLADHQQEFMIDIDTLRKTLTKETTKTIHQMNIKLRTNERINQMSMEMDQKLKEKVQQEVTKHRSSAKTAEQVERSFNDLWKNVTGDIVQEVMADEVVNIETEVQRVVKAIFRKDDHQYIKAHTSQNEGKLQDSPGFTVDKTKHLKPREEIMFKFFGSIFPSDTVAKNLQEFTNKIIEREMSVLNEKEGRPFNAASVEELFRDILDGIVDHKFNITEQYKTDILLYAEKMAVPVFIKMDTAYRINTSPSALLDKKKKSYQKLFKIEVTEGDAAAEFCENVIKELLMRNMEESLSNTELLYELRTRCGKVFKDIRTLEASIMIDLFEENQFHKYFNFINDYETFVKEKIAEKCFEYFSRNKRLIRTAKEKLDHVTKEVLEGLDKAVGSLCSGAELVKAFFENIKRLKIQHEESSGFQELNVKDKEQFGNIVRQKIRLITQEDIIPEINSWSIHRKLEERKEKGMDLAEFAFFELVGCRERCPFCQVQCDNHTGTRRGGNHSATFHRPQGLTGVRNESDKSLVTTDCPTLIATSHLFQSKETKGEWKALKEYNEVYPNWTIIANANPGGQMFWKWVFAKHNDKFAVFYRTEEADIPEEWGKYERDEIIKEIQDKYGLIYI